MAISDRTAALGALCAAVLVAGCAKKPQARTEKGMLPDLPNAAMVVEAGSGAGFHGTRVNVRSFDGAGGVGYGIKPPDAIESMHEVQTGRWALHGDVLLRFEEPRSGAGRALLNLYHLPSLANGSNRPAPENEFRLDEGDHLFFGGGFVALDSVQGNDPSKTDDERAQVTLLMAGEVHEIAVPEFGCAKAGDSFVRAGNVYDGDTPGKGVAFLRVVGSGDLWKDAASVGEEHVASGESLKRPAFEIRTDTLEGRDAGWRALVSLRTDALRRDAVLQPGESIRAGAAEVFLRGADAAGIDVDVAEYAVAAVPENAHFPGAVPVDAQQPAPAMREAKKATRRLAVGQSTEFWDARFEFVGLLANDPTDIFDDTAEFLVHRDGTVDRLFAKRGQRQTVRGQNRWWVLDVRGVTAGRTGECEIGLETGSFLGNPSRDTLPF